MGYVSTRKARLQSQLVKIQAALTSLYDTLGDSSTQNVKSYTFDSGEGLQKTTRRSLSEIQTEIDILEAKERWLINELSNMGLVSIRLRRKTP